MKPDNNLVPDRELAAQFRDEGSRRAFDELHERYRDRVFNYLFRMAGQYQLAEDLTQEVFIAVYFKIGKLKHFDNVGGWIFKIAANIARMEFRKRKSSPECGGLIFTGEDGREIDITDLIPNNRHRPDRLAIQKALEASFQDALSELPLFLREVFVLCAIQGVGYGEAANILGIRPKTASSRLSRAKSRLIEALGLRDEPERPVK